MRSAVLAPTLVLCLAGCSLDKEGLYSGPVDAGAVDAAMPVVDAQPPEAEAGPVDSGAPPQDAAVESCAASLPSGWRPVLYAPGSSPCPVGTGPAISALANPDAGAGACTCDCAVTSQPSCATGDLNGTFSVTGLACALPTPAVPITGHGCTALATSGPMPKALSYVALPQTGGACTGAQVGNPGLMTTDPARVCEVPGTSPDLVCAGTPPSGFSACLAAPGDVACPAGSPFSNRAVVATSYTLTCSACSTCTVGGSCVTTEVSLYSDTGCTSLIETLPTGACTQTAAGSLLSTLVALKYFGQPQPTCAASGSTPSFQAAGAQTLCCR